jgi:hypothetical protein
MMNQKIFRAPLELKANGEEGEFRAVFATMNVIDWHEDVTEPGAFANGKEVIIEPWNHGWTLPAGKGVIQSDDKQAWVDGKFFVDTEAGRETYRTVKNLGGLGEWSYTFDIEESGKGDFNGKQVRFLRKLDVVGVGPVTRGAGIGTRTEMIKQKGDGDEGEIENDKPSEPDAANLMTEITIVEIGVIALGGLSNEEKR